MRKVVIGILMIVTIRVFANSPDDKLRKAIVDTALTYRGVPYVYGAESPKAFDCSGFVRYVYGQAAGIVLPRTSRAQFAAGIPVKPEKARPGDVLVFDTVGGAPSHVAIFIDNGKMIHAASAGPSTGVIVSPLTDRYFGPRLIGAREFLASLVVPPLKPEQPADQGAAKPESASVEKPKTPPAAEVVVSTVGFSITNEAVIYADKIPAAVGTAIQFAVTNDTGAGGVFEILFYKMDKDPSKNRTLRRDRVNISADAMKEVEPFTFTEPGQYKLILKTHDNIKRVERTWRVVELK